MLKSGGKKPGAGKYRRMEVIDRKGKVRFIAKSRSACLEWEQQNLQPE